MHDDQSGRVSAPAKKRFIDYPRNSASGARRWVPSWKLTCALGVGFVGVVLGGGAVAYAVVQVPGPSPASQVQSNVYYWADGTPMVSTGGELDRQIIPIGEIPEAMQNAVVSAENKSFYTDSGVDPEGIARSLVGLTKGGETQGGSTITEQYVRMARSGDQDPSLPQRAKEVLISAKLGSTTAKKDILAGYLNTSYFGRGAYGIEAAARAYYGVNARQLNPSQCAFLVSLLKGPTLYDPAGDMTLDPAATPAANTARAKSRWKWTLDRMAADGPLSAAKRATYTRFPMPDPPSEQSQLDGQIGYLVDLAKANFLSGNTQGVTADDLSKGGYEIHTTFDKKKVAQLEKAVKDVRAKHIDPKKRPDTDTYVQFGGASVEPGTGKIVAVYGGEDATRHPTDNADQTGVQVGSAFEPFVLAAAMEHGVRDPKGGKTQPDAKRARVTPDTSSYSARNRLKIRNYDGSVWTDGQGREWLQTNNSDENVPQPVTLREAMQDSLNSPFVQLGMDVGIPTVRQEAEDAGLLANSLARSDVPSFSIGDSDPSVLRMAGAYGTFGAHGRQRDPYSVEKVVKGGQAVYRHEDKPKEAMPAQVADGVTDVLKTVVKSGTGANAQVKGVEVAGKTGTTDGSKAAWFVGYTPQLSTAVDMYRLDDNAQAGGRRFLAMYGTGGQAETRGAPIPSELFKNYMTAALNGTQG
jgi:membrane peptidoglycan carboxypeptidase